MGRQPNIVLIMTDQQRADSMGYAGKHPGDTPFLDSLAARGTIFALRVFGSASTKTTRSSAPRTPRSIRSPACAIYPLPAVCLLDE